MVHTLIKTLCDRVPHIETLEAVDKNEKETSYRRRLDYDRLPVRLVARSVRTNVAWKPLGKSTQGRSVWTVALT